MVRYSLCAFMPYPMTQAGIANQLGLSFFLSFWICGFFVFVFGMATTDTGNQLVFVSEGKPVCPLWVRSLGVPLGLYLGGNGWFCVLVPALPKGRGVGWAHSPIATASRCCSSHQGPAFLYGLGFLIKSTHYKGPLARFFFFFCKEMGTISGLI